MKVLACLVPPVVLLIAIGAFSRMRARYGAGWSQAVVLNARAAWHSWSFRIFLGLSVMFFTGVWLVPGVTSDLIVGALAPYMVVLTIFLMPPLAIVLASSRSDAVRAIVGCVQERCLGRVVYFVKSRGFGGLTEPSSMTDNLYQVDASIWKSVVLPLVDIVTLIVVDLSSHSEGLSDELEFRAARSNLAGRTVVFAPGRTSHLLARYGETFRLASKMEDLRWNITRIWREPQNWDDATHKHNLESCCKCGLPMMDLSRKLLAKDLLQSSKGCFRCGKCGRLTCFDCSDNRLPCVCGSSDWQNRSYVTP